jgi:alpha-N-arabinofuranosidase
LGRETFLTPLIWADDGFPLMGESGKVPLELALALPSAPEVAPAPRDDFDESALALHWNYLRNPELEHYSLSERPGFLRLRGSEHGLSDVASPSWLGRRQCHFSAQIAACLEFEPNTERDEAGLVVRMNEQHHYEIFVTLRSGTPHVVLRRRIGSLQAEVASQPLAAGAVRLVLAITAERSRYVFAYGAASDALTPLGEGETRYLSSEVAGGFTGVFLAMFASGNGAACQRPADFDWFDYQPLAESAAP